MRTNKFEVLIKASAILLFVGLSMALYEKSTSEKINLVKYDWECAKYEALTIMQPIPNGKTTSLIPITQNTWVMYKRR